jgi:hypothetical protein
MPSWAHKEQGSPFARQAPAIVVAALAAGGVLRRSVHRSTWYGIRPARRSPFTRCSSLRRSAPPSGCCWRRLSSVRVGAGLPMSAVHTFIVAALFASYYYGHSPAATWDVFQDRMHMGYVVSVVIYCAITVVIGVPRGAREPSPTPGPIEGRWSATSDGCSCGPEASPALITATGGPSRSRPVRARPAQSGGPACGDIPRSRRG